MTPDTSSTDTTTTFPLKTTATQQFIDDGSNIASTKGRIKLYNGIYYRIMPYAPGIDYAINSFGQFLTPQYTAPTCLFRRTGATNEQCTYFQGKYFYHIYVLWVLLRSVYTNCGFIMFLIY